jgi:flagellum-specific ATP synthase
MDLWSNADAILSISDAICLRGSVVDVRGLIIEADGPSVGLGANCRIEQNGVSVHAQVVGFKPGRILLMPFGELLGIAPGAAVVADGRADMFPVSRALLGRVIDPMGNPMDGKGPIQLERSVELYRRPPSPLHRQRIHQSFDVGIRVVNSFLRVGRGQRLAIMAGSGVGKSTFLSMIARHAINDVNVIGLVGERGREVKEFIEKDLGPEGLKRSVIVVATSDSSALMRIRAAFVATAISEFFRDLDQNVSLMIDSITRLCMSQREIGLAIGEPPSSSGYTPSVFAMLPKLLERAGNGGGKGSITGFYTVLVEGDDMNEPVSDAVRGILDGHIVLSRRMAGRGQYPAVEVLQSVSRLMSDLATEREKKLAALARRVIADYEEVEDLITIGAYKPGQNEVADFAVAHIKAVREFLQQRPSDATSIASCEQMLTKIFPEVNAEESV